MELRDIIIRYRREHGLSQRAFAVRCGLSNGYIAMIEGGRNPSTGKPVVPSFRNLQALAEGMNMTTRALIEIADDMQFTNDDKIENFPEIALVNDSGKKLAKEFVMMLSKMDEYKR